ncbi:MAG: hypothetical protein LBQ70_02690 [Prevotellaceae bacterium]|jgi:hypothetical protein|nr:hypothetical protein [Prevotellaceae bacterium]
MEQDEKDKLLAYAIKMIERGDRFSDILAYLDRKGADSEFRKKIIPILEEHRKLLESQENKKQPYTVSSVKIVFGISFCILTLYLWKSGIIVFPWTLLGVLVAVGTLIETVKIFLNFFGSKKT